MKCIKFKLHYKPGFFLNWRTEKYLRLLLFKVIFKLLYHFKFLVPLLFFFTWFCIRISFCFFVSTAAKHLIVFPNLNIFKSLWLSQNTYRDTRPDCVLVPCCDQWIHKNVSWSYLDCFTVETQIQNDMGNNESIW